MKTINMLSKATVLTLAAFMLSGCNNAAVESAPATPQHKESQHYHSPGKPSAAIEMSYTLSSERVAVGETVNVSVSFDNAKTSVKANINTSEQLLLSGAKQLEFAMSKSGEANAQQTFQVTPTTEGIHLINLIAQDNNERAKPFVIRVIAGDKPVEEYLEVNGTLTEDEHGQKIISMTAEEK